MKFFKIFLILLLNFSILNAQENKIQFDCKNLLISYLANDIEVKKSTLEIANSELLLKKEKINNGFDINLSTGNITFYPNNSDLSSFSIKPTLSAEIPTLNNFSAEISTEYENNSSSSIKNSKISLGIDIFSENVELSKISILKSERTLLESKRNLKNQMLVTENNFYTELKSVLSSINSIQNLLKTTYDDKLDLQKLKAQGYSNSSSTYRIQQMKVSDDEHNIQTLLHNLKLDIIVFYNHCGIEINNFDEKNYLDYVPENIPVIEGINFSDFKEENYKNIENSEWTHKINQKTRKAEKKFTLSANAGYTLKNSTTNSDTVDAGISSNFQNGLNLDFGMSVPVLSENFNPAFTVSAKVNPNSLKLKKINSQQNELQNQKELLEIQNAKKNYETAKISYAQKLENLKWEKESVQKNYEHYFQNEIDLKKYFNEGIISESEYLSAKNNRDSYKIKILINKIDFISYNNQVKNEFVEN